MNTLRGQINAVDAVRYTLAGNATVTFLNTETGNRFTYRVSAPKVLTPAGGKVTDFASEVRFVACLSGQDNERDFQYLGTIFATKPGTPYAVGRKSRVSADAPSQAVFAWVWDNLVAGTLPATIAIFHEGACARCGRKLTVPVSVATGYGPDCMELLGITPVAPIVAGVVEEREYDVTASEIAQGLVPNPYDHITQAEIALGVE